MRPRDISLDRFEPLEDGPSRLARIRRALSTAAGAVLAVALLVAIGVWFYGLGVRDPENVPIIRAAAEPAKTRPEDPGGAVAPHQDITSYRVAESRPTQASAVVIAPPPPEPRREDVPMGALVPEPPERPAVQETAPAGRESPRPGLSAAEATMPAAAQDPAEPERATGTPAEQLAALGGTSETAGPAVPGAVPAADRVPGATDHAPTVSPIAPRRPPDLRERMAAAVQSARQSADDLARRAAESEIQVQLAADPDEGVIRAMWSRISQANSDILHDRELAVQTTVSGGTTFYRLRVGPFGGVSEARAVCQALKARGQDCIVARNG